MIGPDSPVETVLGNADKAKRDLVVDKLGLRTVGDLVHHLPRRYLRTAELTLVEDVEEGQVLVVVGRVVATRVIPYEDRRTGKPAYRVEAILPGVPTLTASPTSARATASRSISPARSSRMARCSRLTQISAFTALRATLSRSWRLRGTR